ncbi:hypothetical protein L0222_03160 [bacterium]|nr:hypothetical protein [bacterium]
MKNVTLSVDDKELEAGRRYAEEQGLSLNSLIRQLLRRTVHTSAERWMDECFELMDQAKIKGSKAKSWKREDIYDV